jgi:hypothetical protein
MDPRQRAPPLNTSAPLQAQHNRRFSYAETPVDMQQDQGFGRSGQRYMHNQASLPEVETPTSPAAGGLDGYHVQTRSPAEHPLAAQAAAMNMHATGAGQQPVRPERMSSPYGVPEPTGVHPAYYAPVASQTPQTFSSQPTQYQQHAYTAAQPQPQPQPQSAPQQQTRRSSTIPMQSEADARQPQPHPQSPTKKTSAIQPDHVQIPYSPNHITTPTQPIFAPSAAIGPNGLAPSMHQPGQVAHPNMSDPTGSASSKSAFQHSLCECSGDMGTCFTGLFCPCILDSRTAYRMGRRSKKLDPTDMLGFSSCNGRCGVMGVFGVCGLCCEFLYLTTLYVRLLKANAWY